MRKAIMYFFWFCICFIFGVVFGGEIKSFIMTLAKMQYNVYQYILN